MIYDHNYINDVFRNIFIYQSFSDQVTLTTVSRFAENAEKYEITRFSCENMKGKI